jgi:hypothetical protein
MLFDAFEWSGMPLDILSRLQTGSNAQFLALPLNPSANLREGL